MKTPKKNVTIEEYFQQQEPNKDVLIAKELFKADQDVDIKTDLTLQEIGLINSISWNNDFLTQRGLKPIYKTFLNNYLRLKISLDRKSRIEFVDMNKHDRTDDHLTKLGTLSNLQQIRK